MNWLWVIPAIGALLLVIAALILQSRLSFESAAVRADGEVVDVVQSSRIDNDGRRSSTWCPAVQFTSETGGTLTFTAQTCSNPPSYRIGEHVDVLYRPGEPESAAIDGPAERWLLPLVVGGIGSVFMLIGLFITLPRLRSQRTAAEVKVSGRPIMARVIDVSLNSQLRVDGRSPWRIHAQWLDPATNTVHVFDSEDMWFDPAPYLDPEIRVLVDPKDMSRYWVDVDTLPKMA
jgi:Protein of unknown function (DUF3592)